MVRPGRGGRGGKYADLIAVEGDPLTRIDTLAKVMFVMKGGEVVRSPTK